MDRTHIEERIGYVVIKISECHRALRVAEDARVELDRLRVELLSLASEYVNHPRRQGLKQIK